MQSQVQLAAQREINQEISFSDVQPCVLPPKHSAPAHLLFASYRELSRKCSSTHTPGLPEGRLQGSKIRWKKGARSHPVIAESWSQHQREVSSCVCSYACMCAHTHTHVKEYMSGSLAYSPLSACVCIVYPCLCVFSCVPIYLTDCICACVLM